MDNPGKFYITTPIYYVNARPHIGHAYTTIACDTIARRQRMLGYDTYFLTGTDEHGQKIERAATRPAGNTPQQFADEVSAEFRALWDRMSMTYDDFIRTTEPRHKTGVQDAVQAVAGKRLHLQRHPTPANTAFPTSCTLMRPGPALPALSAAGPPKRCSEENYFFKLSALEDKLLKLYAEQPDFIRPETRRNEVISFVRSGLRDLSISRSTFKWGIPVPGDPEACDLRVARRAGQLHHRRGLRLRRRRRTRRKFEHYWPADVHMIGKEIVRFHCVYWPAFLMAAGLPLPKSIVAHGWLLFEESKMSKSRGNIVRARRFSTCWAPTRCATSCCAKLSSGRTDRSASTRWCSATTPIWPTAWAISPAAR